MLDTSSLSDCSWERCPTNRTCPSTYYACLEVYGCERLAAIAGEIKGCKWSKSIKSNKKLLVTKGIATKSKFWPYY